MTTDTDSITTTTCLTCGRTFDSAGPWNTSVAYCSACVADGLHRDQADVLATWPGDAPLMFWVHFLLGTTDTFAFVTMNADAAGMEGEELRQALTPATAAALGVPDEVVTVKAWRITGEPPF